MGKNKKFYVVWRGRNPGVYDDWNDALEQIEEFPGALYKSFNSSAEATEAYRRVINTEEIKNMGQLLAKIGMKSNKSKSPSSPPADYMSIPEIDLNGWAVDASCMGNPGIMEYRGVELISGKEIFRIGPFRDATNNIGEFLAIVHALALMAQKGENHTIYSDSVSGMAWVRNKRIKTTLKPTPANARLFELMTRALTWLNTHQYSTPIRKWQTELWGEIPADFGRK